MSNPRYTLAGMNTNFPENITVTTEAGAIELTKRESASAGAAEYDARLGDYASLVRIETSTTTHTEISPGLFMDPDGNPVSDEEDFFPEFIEKLASAINGEHPEGVEMDTDGERDMRPHEAFVYLHEDWDEDDLDEDY